MNKIGNCTYLTAEFIDKIMDEAKEIKKTNPLVNQIRDEWNGLGGTPNRNRINDPDVQVYRTADYLVFQESGIEHVYKLTTNN